MATIAALIAAVPLAGCQDAQLQAVGGPGGVFRSGSGCAVEALESAGAAACLAPAQLGFEQLADGALVQIHSGNIGGKQVSCRRSFCGTGALAVHADYRWRVGVAPTSDERLGQLHYRLPVPVEVYGKTMTYALYLDGPTTSVNAYIAIIDGTGRFRMVHDGPVLIFRDWTRRGAVIDATNTHLELPPDTRSLMAKEVHIAVYLATDVRSGDREHWSADFYLDEIGWK
jgi:hypothetical protein